MKKLTKYTLGFITLLTFSFFIFCMCAKFIPINIEDKSERIIIYDNDSNIMYESSFNKNITWHELDEYPNEIIELLVYIEDQRFYKHIGFDPIRIIKALYTNVLSNRIVEGGSTITQQMSKNLFLSNDQTFTRKFIELFYSVQMELQYSKEEILENYLNTLYLGHGIYGFHEASEFYFDRPLKDCSIAQMATLIGIINGPTIYSPYNDYEASIKKRNQLLEYLYINEYINKNIYDQSINEQMILSNKKIEKDINSYYIQAVIDEITTLDLKMNNLSIYTNYDQKAQQALTESINTNSSKDECETSGIILEPNTGAILALSGGKNSLTSEYIRPLYSKRQVGSTIKPLLYYHALEAGFTPSTQFLSSPTSFLIDDETVYAPTNFDEKYPNRDISMINAIAVSDNIYAMKTHLFLGSEVLSNSLNKFNVFTEPLPSLALGTSEMTLLQLTSIFNTFANVGYYNQPTLINCIYTDNELIFENKNESIKYFQQDETIILNQMLTSPFDIKNKTITFPTLFNMNPNVKVAAKSGTSNYDSLIVGFNTEYTIGIWSGFDDGRFLDDDYYNISKLVFRDTFNKLYENETSGWYTMSNNIESKIVDPITGNDSLLGSEYWYIKK